MKDKIVVVTGAASGIGAQCARVLKSQGATVIGVDRNIPDAELVDQFIQVDLSDPNAIAVAVERVTTNVDGLCNIAGLPPTRGREAVLKVNFFGLRDFTEALLPRLNRGASIVNLASLAGAGWQDSIESVKAVIDCRDFERVESLCELLGIDDARSYFLSKEALIVWTMQNRWTWRDRDIRMNCVSPGPVETPIHQDFLATLGARAEEDMRLMERAGRPDDIAPLVAFLCSNASRWIRGSNIPCDGGMLSNILCESHGI
ncbi:coniferyl-alcohol dehydrogenase [Burkholderia cepacia]|uniref:coniferyl-alcohol dehydrogenase n=1 Tax=Burkholderia cepacia TaxID=292 RepID=UPI002AB6D2CE|nr:coniferyl-alcohol dehydrogenase [Burkholderia cepacia]